MLKLSWRNIIIISSIFACIIFYFVLSHYAGGEDICRYVRYRLLERKYGIKTEKIGIKIWEYKEYLRGKSLTLDDIERKKKEMLLEKIKYREKYIKIRGLGEREERMFKSLMGR